MKRRDFLATGSLAVLAATPAVSSAPPTAKGEQIHWKMVTAWPKNFPGVGVSASRLAENIRLMSGGRRALVVTYCVGPVQRR